MSPGVGDRGGTGLQNLGKLGQIVCSDLVDGARHTDRRHRFTCIVVDRCAQAAPADLVLFVIDGIGPMTYLGELLLHFE